MRKLLAVAFCDLDAAAALLRDASEMAENLTTDLPADLDCGVFSGPAGEVLAHLIHVTAQVVIGLGALGDAVTAAADAYRAANNAVRDRMPQPWTN